MKIKIQALWIYYKTICPFTLLVSVSLCFTYAQYSKGDELFLFSKLITLLLTGVMLKVYHRVEQFPFYENLGIKPLALITQTLLFDFFVFILLLILINQVF